MNARVLTSRQVAERFNLHVKTVGQLARRRQMPCFRISDGPRGHFRFREDEVDAWFERRRVGRPAAQPAPARQVRDETFR